MHLTLITLVVLTGSRTDGKLGDAARPVATRAITSLPPANPVQSPPPVVVQFHEDAATKDDLILLGEKITGTLKPLDTRLASVERRTESLARDVAVLKAARQAPPPTAAAKTESKKLYLTDAEGIQCWGWEESELRARVARRNEDFARRSTRFVQPQYYAVPPMGFGGGFSAPMTLGGGFMSGGCAGGNCR